MSQATLSDRPYENSNLFSGHYLDERVQSRPEWDCEEDAREAMDDLRSLYDLECDLVSGYGEDSLIDNWIDEVLDVLGFGTNVETTLPDGGGYVDVLLFEDTDSRRDAAATYLDTEDTIDLFEGGIGIVEAKQWDADFTTKFDEGRPYRNASHQIKHYLEKTPSEVEWGILTNGRKWRLYGTRDYETETYYEVDLPELLESGSLEAFKYFYVFFRPEAFESVSGETFLDRVYAESETAAQQLGADLQDNVFTALRVLGRGFAETNDLEIDPDDGESLAALKEQSLVLLYRLMFVLYAESRGLIHPESQEAAAEYEENFSLDTLRLEIHEEIGEIGAGFDAYSAYSTTMWSRLEDLFRLIDEGEETLGIPPYNGGLFDREKHAFLAEHAVSNQALAEVIYRISTTENDEGRYVLADYADLDTRHLGSVYEGLLEHQFRIAPEDYAAVDEDGGQVWKPATEVTVAEAIEIVPEGGLYVVNDEGERKATGAYYTPDYVVTYIVEETVGPLIDEIRADLESQGFEPGTHEYLGAFYRRVTDLKVLDPAMGSGHFLTRATSYIAKQVMDEVRELEEATAFDEQRVRRDVAKECIYGVDLNGMAVELAKLSMWLETLAADQPLAFLDHHLKAGNSLVGSDVTEVLSNGAEGDDNGGQLTLQQSFARVRERTLDHVMDRMQELLEIDNETLEDVKSMEELYDDVRSDPFYQRLFELTNVYTAERFDLEVPEGAYERMAGAIDDDAAWAAVREADWFKTAQAMAGEESFFHWELEYPEVFFNIDGEKLEDAGFDAVIGNPPYVKIQNISESDRRYYSKIYTVARERYDLYGLFIEKTEQISKSRAGMILPNKFFETRAGKPLREYLESGGRVESIVDFKQNQVFIGATTYTCLLFLSQPDRSSTAIEYGAVLDDPGDIISGVERSEIDLGTEGDKWNLVSSKEKNIIDKVETSGVPFDQITDQILVGVQTSANDVFVLNNCRQSGKYIEGYSSAIDERVKIETEIAKPYLTDSEVNRYTPPRTDIYLIYPYKKDRSLLSEEEFKNKYPEAYSYLLENKDELKQRGGENQIFEAWYAHWCPRHPMKFERSKVIISQVVKQGESTYDEQGDVFFSSTVYSPILLDEYEDNDVQLLGILNSTLVWYYITLTGTVLRGGYYRYKTEYLEPISIPVENIPDTLETNVVDILDYTNKLTALNTTLEDYLGSYSDGSTLADVGLAQPPQGAADSILTDTAADRENLRVGSVEVVRESPSSVEIRLTARYKPEDEGDHETDRWGYTETEPLPALRITDLEDAEADLLEAFVPVAVDEAGGFANFRETATKTMSLVDRLRKLTLPALEDARDGLESYRKTTAREEELEEKIEKTDELIDQIVYELYGLTEEEIEIVEETVGEE